MLEDRLNTSTSQVATRELLDLLSQVDRAVQKGEIVAIEQINAAVQAAINKACADIYSPIFKVDKATAGTTPNPDRYNYVFTQLISDLTTSFQELKYIGDLVVANFNRLVTEEKSIVARTKKLYNKLQDLSLFSNTAGERAVYVSDDFVGFDFIDFDARFVDPESCFVDTEQGLVTLPRSAVASTIIVSDVKINDISNGVQGNNQQLDAAYHGNINEILDSNPDTWWEYEKVGVTPSSDPLILSLTLTLSDEYIINHIRVNPNNFGTSNWVKITSLETSVDDKVYTSIKENLPIEGFIDIIKDESFTLSPASSKFAGQGLFTFMPRKARYVRVVFEQGQGYYINTTSGQRYRYAIGLRDLEINAVQYKSEGSVVSLPFAFTEEIRKVALVSIENPIKSSPVGSIEHYVSLDDGTTWNRLQPLSGEDADLSKILTFNDESPNAIKTSGAANTIRHKAVLKRDGEGFQSDKTTVGEKVTAAAELRQIPSGEPFNVTISQRPVGGSVRIVNPIYGSKGWTSPRLYVGTSDGRPGQEFIINAKIREGEEKVYVDSQLWHSTTVLDSEYQYVITYEAGQNKLPKIKFGFSNSVPERGSIITIELPAEDVVVEGKEPHTIILGNPTDGDVNAIEVVRYSSPKVVVAERIAQGASRIYLRNKNIDDIVGITFSEPIGYEIFLSEKTFIDGVTELTATGDYSVDYVNGIIYAKGTTTLSGITTVGYTYIPITIIPKSNWKLSSDPLFKTLELDHSVFKSIKVEDEDLSSYEGKLKITLANTTVVRGSLRFSDLSLNNEIPFIDGITEFLDVLEVEDEAVPTGGTGFTLVNVPLNTYPVVFSDTTVFVNETATPTDPGDYYVNYSTGEVTTITTLNNGTVSYHYLDTVKQEDLNGSYSIDYLNGIVYLYDPLGPNVTVDYEYTQYAVRYRIARPIESFMFTVDADNKLITITDPDVIDQYLPTTRHAGLVKVFYNYIEQLSESIDELEPFFTPILEGYALKILTPGLL